MDDRTARSPSLPIPEPGAVQAHIGRLLHDLRIARRLLKLAEQAHPRDRQHAGHAAGARETAHAL